MYSTECVTIHRIYQRFKSSTVPLILIFIGLSVLHFILRRYVIDNERFWCDADLMAVVIIIAIIDLFEGLLHENQLLYEKITEKTEKIRQKNLNIDELKGCNERMRNSQLSVQDVEERLSKSFSAESKFSKSLRNDENKKLLKENEQLRNQILNQNEIFQQQKTALNQLKTANELLEEKVKIQNKEIQQLQIQLLIKDENIQKREKTIKDFEKLSRETQKQLSKKGMIILEMNEKINELEKEILKLKNDQKLADSLLIPKTPAIKNHQTEVVCKKCQKQNVQHEGHGLIQPENTKVINNMLSPSREKLILSHQSNPVESDDDDLPAPPPSIAEKFLNQTYTLTSIFSSSTPTFPAAASESTIKSMAPPPIPPKPKRITCSSSISSPPPPPPPLPTSFTKSLSTTPSSSSSNVTPKRTSQNIQRILSPDLQNEIRSPPKLKNSDEAEKEREKRKSNYQKK